MTKRRSLLLSTRRAKGAVCSPSPHPSPLGRGRQRIEICFWWFMVLPFRSQGLLSEPAATAGFHRVSWAVIVLVREPVVFCWFWVLLRFDSGLVWLAVPLRVFCVPDFIENILQHLHGVLRLGVLHVEKRPPLACSPDLGPDS